MYAQLMERYPGLTPNAIAEHTPWQILSMWNPNETTDTLYFATDAEYQRWLTSRR